MRFSLRQKLLVFSVALALIPLAAAARSMIRITQDELKSSANDQLGTAAEQVAGEINELYENTWLAPLLLIRNAVDSDQLSVEGKVSLLTQGIRDITDLVALQLTARDLEPILVLNDGFSARLVAGGANPAETLRLAAGALDGVWGGDEPQVTDLTRIPQTDDWMLTFLLPLRNGLAGRDAVLSARINLARLRASVEEHPLNQTGDMSLVRSDGRQIFDPAQSDISNVEIVADALAVLDSNARSIGIQPFQRPDGEAMLGAYSFPDNLPWAVIVEKREEDAYLAVARMVQSLLLWVAVGLLVAVVGAVVFALGISRPVLEIGRVAHEVSQGNLRARVQGVKSRDEIGDLGKRMNEMIQGLVERFNLEKFVSGETISAVKGGGDEGVQLGGVRKRVTVFFSDIRGFTAFSEKVEPEVVVEMLNTFLSHQAQIVKKHHGDIDKFVGDEVVAVFQGDRMVHDAVQCALEIQHKMAELRRLHVHWDVHIGIGINTGEVVMGAMGSEDRMDFTILGDNVNLGARLCSNAGPGQILLSQTSYRAVASEPDFLITPLDPIRVKNKSEPVLIYGVSTGS